MTNLDLIASVVFLIAQWRIAVLVLRFARRFAAKGKIAARAAVAVFLAAVAAGYACSFSNIVSGLHLSRTAAPVAGGLALAYLMTSTGVLAIYTVFDAIQKRLNAVADPGRRRVLNIAGNALMASPLAVMGYGALVQRTDFHVRELDVPLAGLPAGLDGLRVLHLSDIHLSVFLSEHELARAIDACCELQPQVAFITGDLISTFGDPLEACIRQLARVRADAGVFGCLGNHDHYAHVEARATRLAARRGIRFLRAESQQLRFGGAVLNVAGVDYQPLFHKDRYLRGAEHLVAQGAFNLLLSHNPDVFPVAVQQGYDLMLSGHTHGGQIQIEIFDQAVNPARFVTPYVNGLYRQDNAAAYVTPGIGTVGIPVRMGVPPEISLLRLRKA